MKKLALILLFIVCLSLVSALQTTYNPFSGKLDYIRSTSELGNNSFNETYTDVLYIGVGDEGNLNVNGSDFWDNFNAPNFTQFLSGISTLTIQEGWLLTIIRGDYQSNFDTNFSAKTTDDLTEGSSNLYDNQSWNEIRGDDIHANITGDTFTGDITLNADLVMNNFQITNVSSNGLWSGIPIINSTNESTNELIFAVEEGGTTGVTMPHFWIQNGAPGQASGISRSFMIVNEVAALQNTTNLTSCQAFADNAGEILKIDCNSSTSGADLIVGDDVQIFGDSWLKDTDGEWHFLTRTLQLFDELRSNTLLNRISAVITAGDLVITDTRGETLVVNLNSSETIFDSIIDSITLNTGTDISPAVNIVTYQNQDNPTLTIGSTTPTVDFSEVATIYLGSTSTQVYLFDEESSHNDEFIHNVYQRFDDQGAIYKTGLNITSDSSSIAFSTGSVKIRITQRDYANTVDSDIDYYTLNSTGDFVIMTGVDSFDEYHTGETVSNNKYFNVVFGVVPVNDSGMRLVSVMQDKPSTEYSSESGAEADSFNSVNFFPPNSDLKKTFVPIARVIIKKVAGTDTLQTLSDGLNHFDIRGSITSAAGTPASPSITDHNLLNNLDAASSSHTGFIFDTDFQGAFDLNFSKSSGWNKSGTNVFLNALGDSVGIGTTSPTHKLNVVGDMNLTGNLFVGGDFTNIHEVSSQGLVLGMNFNNESLRGDTVLDSSSSNNHGLNVGATHNDSGGFNLGGAYEFDGVNDYVNIDSALTDSLASTTKGTWSAWVKPVDISGSYTIMSFGDISANSKISIINSEGAFRVLNIDEGDAVVNIVSVANYFVAGEWTHVAMVQDGVIGVQIYIDGVLIPDYPGAASGPTVWFNDMIGNLDNGRIGDINANTGGEDTFFNGTIDNVQLYDRDLSAAEVYGLYAQKAEVKNSYVSQKDIFVDTAGNVGIGTASPGELLSIYKAASNNFLRVDIDDGARFGGISFYDNADTTPTHETFIQFISGGYSALPTRKDTLEIGTINANDITFRPNNVEAVRFQTGGNVGIGTASPTYPLTVVGNVSTISIWSDGNISASGYITRTSIWDEKYGSVWDFIKPSSDLIVDGKIQHDLMSPNVIDMPFDRKVGSHIEYYDVEEITSYKNETNDIITQEENCDDVFSIELNATEEICTMQNVTTKQTVEVPVYENVTYENIVDDYEEQIVEGVLIDDILATHTQALWELKQENDLLKSRLELIENMLNISYVEPEEESLPLYSCEIENSIKECPFGISGGKQTRCYLSSILGIKTWDYCSNGWVLV